MLTALLYAQGVAGALYEAAAGAAAGAATVAGTAGAAVDAAAGTAGAAAADASAAAVCAVGHTFAAFVAASSSSDSDNAALLPLLLCLSGFINFAVIYFRYRNSDKRHRHEADTKAEMLNLRQYDQLNKRRRLLSSSSMSDRNENMVEGALNSSAANVLGQLSNIKIEFK
jgi:hypothetical protein